MWFWVIFLLLLIVVEETIYYAWNRYVYGPNFERKRKWWRRLTIGLVFIKGFSKREKKITNTNSDKGAPL